MLKNILKLNGAQEMSKNEQKTIQGGYAFYRCAKGCPDGYRCCSGIVHCVPTHLVCPPDPCPGC